jgi:SAM-dependent methyltransferase
MTVLFDMHQRQLRRDRAARLGGDLFLLERAFGDCLDRLNAVPRKFTDALLIGCPAPSWVARLGQFAGSVDARDPGGLYAERQGTLPFQEDAWDPPIGAFDLAIAVGTLDTVNDLPKAFRLIRHALRPNSLFMGAAIGGHSLPVLRAAMRAADALESAAAAHVHPRIEAAALAPLLDSAGFIMPVIDIDRVQIGYRCLADLVRDLRTMGATNILVQRPRILTRGALEKAQATFAAAGDSGRTVETIEILHFAAWTPAA